MTRACAFWEGARYQSDVVVPPIVTTLSVPLASLAPAHAHAGLGAGELGQERRSGVPGRDGRAIASVARGRPALAAPSRSGKRSAIGGCHSSRPPGKQRPRTAPSVWPKSTCRRQPTGQVVSANIHARDIARGRPLANRRDGRFVWVTWLAKLMAGETTCEWAPWFKTNYQYDKLSGDFDQAGWQMQHTRALRELRLARQATGEQVMIERQNSFRWERPDSSLVIGGTPDLVSIGDHDLHIYDVKTGARRESHAIQVMIYMYCLPQEAPVYRNKLLHGTIVYSDGRINIPATAISASFVENFNYFLDILDSSAAPDKAPSAAECRFCDIPKLECPERIEGPVPSEEPFPD